ncbi:MAG: right-handed parallel beta-helix repeat-containing protein, partial [Verrucomicrobiae bacterium]|nr:right-handed parallel beta-helix repeat-containing protein [Verrucomicrobiae bacterium]
SSATPLAVGSGDNGKVFIFAPGATRDIIDLTGASGVGFVHADWIGVIETSGVSEFSILGSRVGELTLSQTGDEVTVLDSVLDLISLNADGSGLIADNRITALVIDNPFTGSITRNVIGGGSVGVTYHAPAGLTGNRISGSQTGLLISVASNSDAPGYAAGSGDNLIIGNVLGVDLVMGQIADQVIADNEIGVSGNLGTILGPNFEKWHLTNVLRDNVVAVQDYFGTIQFNRFFRNGIAIDTAAHRQLISHNVFDRNGDALVISGGKANRFVHNTIYAEGGDGVRVEGGSETTLSDNIFFVRDGGTAIHVTAFTGFHSDFNLLHSENGAVLYHWVKPFHDLLDIQADLARFELHSLGSTVVNPFWGAPHFASIGGLDFRPVAIIDGLRASSPAIDNGNSWGDLGLPTTTVNLLSNSSFESGITGWSTNGSASSVGNPNAWLDAFTYGSGVDRLAWAEQTINLITAGFTTTELDNGTLAAIFGGRARVTNGGPQLVNSFSIILTFLDGGSGVLDTATAQFTVSGDRWELAGDRVALPTGVREIRFRFDADLDVNALAEASFDGAFLEIRAISFAPDHGAYGSTAEDAAASTAAPRIALRSPDLYTDWERGKPRDIEWETFGNSAGAAIKIDLYQNGIYLLTIAAAAPDTGRFTWTPFTDSGIDYGTHGLTIEVSLVGAPTILDHAAEPFSVPENGTDYFVNTSDDGNLGDNTWTTAVGSNRNTG